MKIFEITAPTELKVVSSDQKSTTLEDPKTKVKTVVPNDPKKPGMISKDADTNQLTLNTNQPGEVSNTVKPGDKVKVAEKAVSKAQQQFMGMVYAAQKGKPAASQAVADVANKMKKSDAKDFASTKHKGLPDHVA